MGSVLILCAALTGYTGPVFPTLWGCTFEPVPAYQLEVKLIDVAADGERHVVTTPVITLPAGQGVRLDCADVSKCSQSAKWRLFREDYAEFDGIQCASDTETDRSSAWRIRVGNIDDGKVRLDLSLRRAAQSHTVIRGFLPKGRLINLSRRVPTDKLQKLVLNRDANGRPISWLEVRVRETTTYDFGAASTDQAIPSDNRFMVYPFLQEPF
jgi:hypothetical protein